MYLTNGIFALCRKFVLRVDMILILVILIKSFLSLKFLTGNHIIFFMFIANLQLILCSVLHLAATLVCLMTHTTICTHYKHTYICSLLCTYASKWFLTVYAHCHTYKLCIMYNKCCCMEQYSHVSDANIQQWLQSWYHWIMHR